MGHLTDPHMENTSITLYPFSEIRHHGVIDKIFLLKLLFMFVLTLFIMCKIQNRLNAWQRTVVLKDYGISIKWNIAKGFYKSIKAWIYVHEVLQSETIRLHNNIYNKMQFGEKNEFSAHKGI